MGVYSAGSGIDVSASHEVPEFAGIWLFSPSIASPVFLSLVPPTATSLGVATPTPVISLAPLSVSLPPTVFPDGRTGPICPAEMGAGGESRMEREKRK